MSKAEMVRQSAERANAARIERLASQIEATRQAEVQSAEELAALLEPLAQAMATLADEMRKATARLDQASERLDRTSERLDRIGSQIEWRHYGMAALVSVMASGLVLASWLWLAPLPIVQNHLDPKAVAEHLQPALTCPPPPPAAPATTRRR